MGRELECSQRGWLPVRDNGGKDRKSRNGRTLPGPKKSIQKRLGRTTWREGTLKKNNIPGWLGQPGNDVVIKSEGSRGGSNWPGNLEKGKSGH